MLDVNWVSIPLLCQLILPPFVREWRFLKISSPRRQNGKETFSASWLGSLLFFGFRNLCPSIKRRNNLKSPLGLILLRFCWVICRFVSAKYMVVFCCRSLCCETASHSHIAFHQQKQFFWFHALRFNKEGSSYNVRSCLCWAGFQLKITVPSTWVFSWIWTYQPLFSGLWNQFWGGNSQHVTTHKDLHSKRYTIVKVDGATSRRWRKVSGHDKPRLMGVASHRPFPGGIYSPI